MRASRPPSAIATPIVFLLFLVIPMMQPTLLARGGQRPEEVGVAKGGVPDPCELAAVPPGEANGLHRRCDAAGGGAGVARGDFNGDGFADLAIGAPYEDIDGINAPGMVQIIYGSSTGLTATGDQAFDMSDFGYPLQSNTHFGWALAAGDFNGDSFSDLAIGAPEYEFRTEPADTDDGVVFLIDGSSTGLVLSTHRTLDTFLGAHGRQGAALVWGDFNDDGVGDLAVGIPNADPQGEGLACSKLAFRSTNAGEVQVFYGSDNGLSQFGGQVLHQGVCDFGEAGEGVGDSIEDGDRFGSSLTALRNATGADDLVIGAPNEDLGLFDKIDAGVVHFVPGWPTGLDRRNAITISQDTPGVGGGAESNDQFGRVLAGGDFDGNDQADLAIGVPFEDLTSNTEADAGCVNVLFNFNKYGFATSEGQFVSQGGLPNVAVEAGDRFGWALAAGDFDGDGRDDLAIGSPTEDIGSLSNTGLVSVLYGTSVGLSFTRVQHWSQDSAGIADVAEPGDQFGYALSSWNFGNGTRRDLAIGVPFEDLTSTITNTLMEDAGAVHVLFGTTTGLSATSSQFWTQDSAGILDASQTGDRFGQALY